LRHNINCLLHSFFQQN